MRTAADKPSFDEILLGEAELAGALRDCIVHRGPVERYTHGFHSYPAGLHPDAARDLIALFPGDSVLDPFCGGGTVLVEGRAAGRRTEARDLSSVAIRVTRARTAAPSDEVLTRFRSTARKLTAEARVAKELPPPEMVEALKQWYARHAVWELEALRRGIEQADDEIRPLMEAAFSSILIKVSWRRSDTSQKRETHRRPPGTTAVLFHKKVRELARKQAELREAIPPGTPETVVRLADARQRSVKRTVDLVLTSPPYPATYDYLPLQHLRRVWMGSLGPERFQQEIGARRLWRQGDRAARREWLADSTAWSKAAAASLSPGGHLVVVIGDGYSPTGVVDTSDVTERAARAAGFKSVARASVERPDPIRKTVRWEHAFAFRKPES